ncbi:MAG: hypothetical protein ACI4PQ_08565, partial [Butyricicoccaceae bacterium]
MDQLMNLLNLTDSASPTEYLNELIQGSPYASAVMIGSIVISLLLCFFGYRLLKVCCALGSFGLGGLLCSWLVNSLLGNSLGSQELMIASGAAFLIGGLLFAYVMFFFYKLAVFVLFAFIGMAVGSVPVEALSLSGTFSLAALACCAVLFGLAGLLFMRPLIILITACCGFSASSGLVALTPLATQDYASVIIIVLGAVLTVIGAIVQFRLAPSGTAPGFQRRAPKPAADSPEDLPDDAPEQSKHRKMTRKERKEKRRAEHTDDFEAEYLVREGVTTPAEFLGASLRRNPITRLLLKISPILLLVISAALLLTSSTHVEYALIPFIFCYAAQSFGLLTLSSLLLLVHSIPSLIHAMDGGDVPSTALYGISMLVYLIVTVWSLLTFFNHKTGREFVARIAPSEPQAAPEAAAEAPFSPVEEPTERMSAEAMAEALTRAVDAANMNHTDDTAEDTLVVPAEEAPTQADPFDNEGWLDEVNAAVQAQINIPDTARTAPIHL